MKTAEKSVIRSIHVPKVRPGTPNIACVKKWLYVSYRVLLEQTMTHAISVNALIQVFKKLLQCVIPIPLEIQPIKKNYFGPKPKSLSLTLATSIMALSGEKLGQL